MKINKVDFINNGYALMQLTNRNMRIFLKDKTTVFFSLLSPLIALMIYVLFLGDIQVDSVMRFIPEGIVVDAGLIKAFVDSWMIAGVMSIACITVSLCANSIMLEDKKIGILNDALSSPIKKWVITLSYFLFNLIVTITIGLFVFLVCMIFLGATGGWHLSLSDVFGALGIMVISSLSSTFITTFICSFFKSVSTLSVFNTIVGTLIGFLIGAYMPLSIMPDFVQYIAALVPGSHSAGLFRYFLMSGALEEMSASLPLEAVNGLSDFFGMKLNIFGKTVGINFMLSYIFGSIALFFTCNMLLSLRRKKKEL